MDLTAAKGLLYCALGLFVLLAWLRERRKRRREGGPERFWPGTTDAPAAAYYMAAAGAILITVAEAAVEKRAGLTELQSVIPAVFIFQLLGASVVEEALFRGFVAPSELVGPKLLALVVIGSVVFSLIHNFDLGTTEGQVNAAFAFVTSVWLYVMRFNPLNPDRSLLPCLVGHAARNLAVFGIKWAQGYVN
jgi:membrane protease YdiL (CAAX protease family)